MRTRAFHSVKLMNNKVNVAVLVSGGGTNLQAIFDAEDAEVIKSAKVTVVISNNENAYALQRAKLRGVKSFFISKKNKTQDDFENEISEKIRENDIDLIVLAGFMSILSKSFTDKYQNRIINVHPSLIPSFCGKGYYGLKVHESALSYGVKVTGATVHFVNEVPDGGSIIMQKAVYVKEGDTPEVLQRRVMEEAEWIILPRSIQFISEQLLEDKK